MKRLLIYLSIYLLIELLIYVEYLHVHKIDYSFEERVCKPFKNDENYYIFEVGNCSNVFYSKENYITSQPCWIKYINDICYISITQPLVIDNMFLVIIRPILILLITFEFIRL